MQKIILASSSIYRKELLQRLQIPFETLSPHVDETPLPSELAQDTALRLAELKTRTIAKIYPQALIIGSDQVALLDNVYLGKPMNHDNAVMQLRSMSGRKVIFYTALCLLNSATNRLQSRLIPYQIGFRQLSDQQIENYLLKEQPYHCTGSAKSEGLGIALIESMYGEDPNALIGLPLIALVDMLTEEGVVLL